MLASSLSLVILRGALGLRRNHWVLQLFSQGQSIMFALLLVACASWSVLLPSLPKGILGSTGKQCDGAWVVATHRSRSRIALGFGSFGHLPPSSSLLMSLS